MQVSEVKMLKKELELTIGNLLRTFTNITQINIDKVYLEQNKSSLTAVSAGYNIQISAGI